MIELQVYSEMKPAHKMAVEELHFVHFIYKAGVKLSRFVIALYDFSGFLFNFCLQIRDCCCSSAIVLHGTQNSEDVHQVSCSQHLTLVAESHFLISGSVIPTYDTHVWKL